MDQTTTGQPAAIIIEPLLGGPIVTPSREYMQELRRFCTERGILLIVDEALTGLGRTGKWFASEHFDIVPDIMTLSKSLGGAVPLSATMVTGAIAEKLESGGYYQSTSHTGDPFLCGIGLANLAIIEEEGLVENAERMGAYFKSGLEELRNQYEIVGDVRGLGLLLGLEIVRDKESAEPAKDLLRHIEDYCLDRGLILFTTEGTPIIRLAPPLVITRAEIDTALSIMEEAIRSAAEGGDG
jgi:4-aminobutyrate aminotransferase-like enzyme